MSDQKKTKIELVIGLIIVVTFLVLGLFLNKSRSMLVTAIAINIVFGMSFSLLFAYTGMTSMGHAVYYGLGSYFMMIFILKAGISWPIAALLSVVCTTLISVFLGSVCLRNGMASFAFLSMGIANTMIAVFNKWAWVGSDLGLQVSFLPPTLQNYRVMYYLIIGVSIITVVVFYFLTKSPFVKTAKGIRENEERLKFLGLDTHKQRLFIFVVSAFFASISGVLYTLRCCGAYAAQLTNEMSIQSIMMCMVGGTETFFGPILGSVLVTLFVNYVSGWTIYFQGFLGTFVLVTVFCIRDGLISKKVANFFLRLLGRPQIGVKKDNAGERGTT